jgi:hypothetical protein
MVGMLVRDQDQIEVVEWFPGSGDRFDGFRWRRDPGYDYRGVDQYLPSRGADQEARVGDVGYVERALRCLDGDSAGRIGVPALLRQRGCSEKSQTDDDEAVRP